MTLDSCPVQSITCIYKFQVIRGYTIGARATSL